MNGLFRVISCFSWFLLLFSTCSCPQWFPASGKDLHPMPIPSPSVVCRLTLTAVLFVVIPNPAQAALPRVPDGFKVRLVAAVPAVQFPSQVATAPEGSLFVGEDPMDQV